MVRQACSRDDVPSGEHYAAVVFTHREERYYSGSQGYVIRNVPVQTYHVFTSKDDLEGWVAISLLTGTQFVFFKVDRLGSVMLQVTGDGVRNADVL